MNARKSERRKAICEGIINALKNDEVFDRLKYKNKTESELQNRMAIPLNRTVASLLEEYKGWNPDRAIAEARVRFKSEEDPNTTVKNFMFMGVQHRPDFVIDFDDIHIAVEIKKGSSGQSVRECIGQSVVYNTNYDFTVVLYVDTSQDDRIKNAFTGEREQKVVESLWDNHNIMLGVA
jgi:hypothetical protein